MSEDQYIKVYESEYQEDTLNPDFRMPHSFKVRTIHNGDPTAMIRIELWNYKFNGKHKLYGYTVK